MGAVTGALADAARAAGARARTGAEVTRDRARRRGAVPRSAAAGGERRTARPARAGQRRARRCWPSCWASRRRPQAPEGSQLKVNLLLRRLPRLRDTAVAPEEAFAGTFHVNEGYAQLAGAPTRRPRPGSIPEPLPCEAYCHSLTDPSILGPELRAAGAADADRVRAAHARAAVRVPTTTRARERGGRPATLASLDSVLAEPIEDCLLRTPDGAPCLEAHTPARARARARHARRPHLPPRPDVAVRRGRRGRRAAGASRPADPTSASAARAHGAAGR